jgi:hypothetical protein
MMRFDLGPTTFMILLATVLSLGCGNSSRQLQSVTVSPATADAKMFPGGKVSFTAIGTFSRPPSPTPLTSSDVTWCAGDSTGQCDGNIAPSVIIDQNGMAQCSSNFVGIANILAGVPDTATTPDVGVPLEFFGSATLTCP